MKLLLSTLALLLVLAPLRGADTWAFAPGEDAFSPEVAVDLRALNERVAGETGFVRRSNDGNSFVLGDGTPARFWAIDADCHKREDMEAEAKFLAKRGVNLVRLTAVIFCDPTKHPTAKMDEIDRDKLDLVWRWVAALKAQGIYCLPVPYWAFNSPIPESWGIKDHKSLTGVLFCDRTFQDGYKAWLHALYAEKNPYTGVPLAQEPSVAVIQLQNEDSLLWWSLDHFLAEKGQPWDALRHDFGDFAGK